MEDPVVDLPMESSTITTTVLDVEDSQQDRDKNKASEGSAENNTFFEKDRVTGRSRGPGATSLPDLGGNGSCGWHALSYQIAQRSSGWSKSDSRFVISSMSWRSHCRQRWCTTWKQCWVPDEKATELTEGGSIPTDLQSFCDSLGTVPMDLWAMPGSNSGSSKSQHCCLSDARRDLRTWHREVVFWGKGVYRKLPILPLVICKGALLDCEEESTKTCLSRNLGKGRRKHKNQPVQCR